MLKINLLEARMKELKITPYALAKGINMSYQSLNKRTRGVVDFRGKEIAKIKRVLKLTPEQVDSIFLQEN